MLNKLFVASRPTLKQSLFIGGGIGAASAVAIAAHNALNSDAIALEQDANTLGVTPQQLLGLAGLSGLTGLLAENDREMSQQLTASDLLTNEERLQAVARDLQPRRTR